MDEEQAALFLQDVRDETRRVALEACSLLVRTFADVWAVGSILQQRLDTIGAPERDVPPGTGGVKDHSAAAMDDHPRTGER